MTGERAGRGRGKQVGIRNQDTRETFNHATDGSAEMELACRTSQPKILTDIKSLLSLTLRNELCIILLT
jgi:hypothetical protein